MTFKWSLFISGHNSESELDQSCPTLCDSMDRSLPGSSVHGIFLARVLEWGAIACSLAEPKGLGIGSINLPNGTPGIKVRRATSMVPRAV